MYPLRYIEDFSPSLQLKSNPKSAFAAGRGFAALLGGLRYPNNVSNPDTTRLAPLTPMELAAPSTVTPCPFPVDDGVFKSSLTHEILHLRDTPHAPVVGKNLLLDTSTTRLKVDVKSGVVGDRIKELLLEPILETREILRIYSRLAIVRSPEKINEKYTTRCKRTSATTEVCQEGATLLEYEVAKVERANNIGSVRPRAQNVSLKNSYPFPLGG
jgi:hypothetical protein